MSFSRKRRSGFTLAETLVTVAIIAVLAAVVVPAVTQQLGKGDAPAFTSSVGALRTAVTSFVSDVRKFPGDVEDLQSAITGADADIDAVAYSSPVQARWKGPYENSGNSTGQIGVGYGWTTVSTLADSGGFLVLRLLQTNADTTDAHTLDVAVDGGNGGLTGLVRYNPTTSGTAALTPANKVSLYLMSSARYISELKKEGRDESRGPLAFRASIEREHLFCGELAPLRPQSVTARDAQTPNRPG